MSPKTLHIYSRPNQRLSTWCSTWTWTGTKRSRWQRPPPSRTSSSSHKSHSSANFTTSRIFETRSFWWTRDEDEVFIDVSTGAKLFALADGTSWATVEILTTMNFHWVNLPLQANGYPDMCKLIKWLKLYYIKILPKCTARWWVTLFNTLWP